MCTDLDVAGANERRLALEVSRVDDADLTGVEDELGQVDLANYTLHARWTLPRRQVDLARLPATSLTPGDFELGQVDLANYTLHARWTLPATSLTPGEP